MSMDLQAAINAIKLGKMSQFAQPITITAAQQVNGVEVEIDLGQVMSNLWLPPTIVQNYAIVAQPATLVLGIRINTKGAPILPWGLQGNNVSAFTGPVDRIFVTLLSGIAAPITLLGARGIGIGYSSALTAAGTPSASPSFGGSGTPQF